MFDKDIQTIIFELDVFCKRRKLNIHTRKKIVDKIIRKI